MIKKHVELFKDSVSEQAKRKPQVYTHYLVGIRAKKLSSEDINAYYEYTRTGKSAKQQLRNAAQAANAKKHTRKTTQAPKHNGHAPTHLFSFLISLSDAPIKTLDYATIKEDNIPQWLQPSAKDLLPNYEIHYMVRPTKKGTEAFVNLSPVPFAPQFPRFRMENKPLMAFLSGAILQRLKEYSGVKFTSNILCPSQLQEIKIDKLLTEAAAIVDRAFRRLNRKAGPTATLRNAVEDATLTSIQTAVSVSEEIKSEIAKDGKPSTPKSAAKRFIKKLVEALSNQGLME